MREIQEKFYNEPGLLNAKELEKISEKEGRDIEAILQPYNTTLEDAAELGLPVPLGTYIIIKPSMVLVPIRIMIDFDKKKIEISLWEKKCKYLLHLPQSHLMLPRSASDCSNPSTSSVTPREFTGESFETRASFSLIILVANDKFNILIKSNQILLDITYRNGGFRFL